MTLPSSLELLTAGVGGYLLGSAPFGLLLGYAFGVGDLRKLGSGNIGATNMWRQGRKDLAIATFVLDSSKAAIAVLAVGLLFGSQAGLGAGVAASLGHCFPVWLRFKGGKGVSSFFGILLAGIPVVGLAAGATWLATVYTFRISSLGALAAAGLAPVFAMAFHRTPFEIGVCVGLAVCIFWLHRANIARLIKGEEPKFGAARSRS